MRKQLIPIILGDGGGDVTAPTCVITCAQTSPTATTPINLTFTFSEDVTGFEVGDITIGGVASAASNFAGSGSVYTCDAALTGAGNVTVDVAAGVCVDGAGNSNEAAARFVIESRLYMLDQFITTASAPLTSPRTAEPGPGTMVITDASNKLSIAGGKLVGAGGAVSGIWGGARTRAQGLALILDFTKTVAAATEAQLGWDTNQAGAPAGNAVYVNNLTLYYIDNNTLQGTNRTAVITTSTNYKFALILRTSGMYYCIKGGAYTEWTLLQAGHLNSTATLYPTIYISSNMAFESDFMRVVQLGSPFSTDKEIATNNIASPAAGEETTSTANGIVEMEWTAVTGETWNLMVRRTDASNYWAVRCSQGGSTVKLIQVEAGGETERASAAQTFVNGTTYKLIVEMVGDSIRTTIGTVASNQTAMNTYNSASFNNTATGVKTDKAGANLICWPRTLLGSAVTVLDNAVNPT